MELKAPSQELLLERLLSRLAGSLRRYRWCVLGCLGAGALAYMFAFTNKLVNHDEVASLFTKGATVTSGRWGLGALDLVFPNYSMPWLYGVLTLALIAGAVCLMADLFAIRNPLLQGLLGGCVAVFPSLIGTFGYMFTASSFALSFLLAALAVWCAARPGKWGWPAGVVCLVASLSIYQAYISLAAALSVLALVRRLLEGDGCGPVVRRGFALLGFLACGLGLYYAATQAVLAIKDVALSPYAADRVVFSLDTALGGVALAYSRFLEFFTRGACGLMPTALSRWLHGLCLLAAAALLPFSWLGQGRSGVGRFALLLGLLGLLPLAVNCMYLFTSEDAVHTLVLYGFVAVYVLAALLAQRFQPDLWRQLARDGVSLALAAALAGNVLLANQAYLDLHLKYENAYAFYTALAADIKMMPGFTEGTRLAVIGSWSDLSFYDEHFSALAELTGVDGFKPDSYSAPYFLEYYIGFPMEFASEQEVDAIMDTAEFKAMPAYPYYGSLKKIGGVLVVKLSEGA